MFCWPHLYPTLCEFFVIILLELLKGVVVCAAPVSTACKTCVNIIVLRDMAQVSAAWNQPINET